MTFKEFIETIRQITTYQSKMNKSYQMVNADSEFLILKDIKTEAEFKVEAPKLYTALKELGFYQCTISALKPYVGAKAAPVCADLIYHLTSSELMQSTLSQISDIIGQLINKPNNIAHQSFQNKLKTLDKNDLIYLAEAFKAVLYVQEAQSMSKQQLLQKITTQVFEHTKEWVIDIPLYELKYLKIFLKEEYTQIVTTPQLLLVEDVMLVEYSEGGALFLPDYISIHKEMRQTLLPHIDSAIAYKEERHEGIIEELLIGILNTRGHIAYQEVIEILKRLAPAYDKQITPGDIEHCLSHSMLVRTQKIHKNPDGDDVLYSYFCDAEVLQQHIKADIAPYEINDIKEILARSTYPFLTPYRPCEKKFYEIFKNRYPLNQDRVKYAYTYFYIRFQDPTSPISEIIQEIWEELDLDIEQDIDSYIQLIAEFNNNIPKFHLQGNSSATSFDKCRNNAEINYPSMSMPNPHSTVPANPWNDSFEPYITTEKIGRNEPCPCGSGKKYKKCCGSSN